MAEGKNEVPEGFAVHVISLEDRFPEPAFLNSALRLNERYSARHGLQFRLFSRCRHLEDMPPCWARVKLVAEAHQEASKNPDARGFVLGLDAAAAFASLSYDIRQELVEVPRDKAVVVVQEAPFHESGGKLSACFFGVRLGPAGQRFLEEWLSCYDAGRWIRRGRAWSPVVPGAGDAYEQGQLNRVVAQNGPAVHELPQWVLNSGFPRAPTAGAVLPGILNCTPWPGEEPAAREARAARAFQELLDSTALSDVSSKNLQVLRQDELARTTELLGRPPRGQPAALKGPTTALAPAQGDLAAAMQRASEAAGLPRPGVAAAPAAPYECLD